MTNTALALDRESPLVELLSEQFSEAALDRLLALDGEALPWKVWDESLFGPLEEFLSRPGKEFRSRLTAAAWELAGQRHAPPRELPLIVEVLHAGSLIVDDIEDGSTYRRGAPALHTRWGVPKALNAGCWLYFWTDALVERLALAPPVELEIRRLVDRTLLRAHQGQALDLSTQVVDLAQRDVPSVVHVTTRLKTGSLMQLAAGIGAVAAGARPEVTEAISKFGRELGASLQMLDDLGGIVSEARCHKGHEDLIGGRPTWPWAWAARYLDSIRYAKLAQLGREVIRRDTHPEYLAEELRELVGQRGKVIVASHLRRAFEELKSTVGDAAVLGDIRHEIELLEKSYG